MPGINYLLDLTCRPRKLFGVGGLLDAYKLRNLSTEIDAALERNDSVPTEFKIVKITPQQTLSDETLSLEDLKKRAQSYEVYAADCRACPANIIERMYKQEFIFGCHGAIDYPITHEMEFLLNVTTRLVTQRLLDQAPSALIHFILETGISGETVKNLRENREEGLPPFSIRDECLTHGFLLPDGQETTIDTDQLLETFFFAGRIDTQLAKRIYTPFFQVMESVVGVVANDTSPVAGAERLKSIGVVQLRQFAQAVIWAGDLGCNVVIDR